METLRVGLVGIIVAHDHDFWIAHSRSDVVDHIQVRCVFSYEYNQLMFFFQKWVEQMRDAR